jgi:hypothetical protein
MKMKLFKKRNTFKVLFPQRTNTVYAIAAMALGLTLLVLTAWQIYFTTKVLDRSFSPVPRHSYEEDIRFRVEEAEKISRLKLVPSPRI